MRLPRICITTSAHVEAVIMMTYCGLNKKTGVRPQDVGAPSQGCDI